MQSQASNPVALRRSLFAFGAVSVLGGLILSGVSVSYLADAERARGTVVALEWGTHGRDPVAHSVVKFTSADGTTRKFESSFDSNPPTSEKGDSVEVLYRADSPEDARINERAVCDLMPYLRSPERVGPLYPRGSEGRVVLEYPGEQPPALQERLIGRRWALIEPLISAWKAQHPSVNGHQGAYGMREIVNALLYQSRTGCQWDYLPHDLPPAGAVRYYFCKWRDDGTDQTIHDLLRWQVRERKRRLADPSLVVLDTQSLHAAAGVPAATTGRDANKKVPGVKRGLAVDVLGLVIAVVVLAASVHDNVAGIALLNRVVAGTEPGVVKKALVDQGFKNAVVDHGAKAGIDVEVVKRNPGDTGFVPQSKRWVVEQVNGILMLHRRLVRDYEHRSASAESRVYWAISDRMSRMLTGTSAPAWRGA
ncbi:IS5 family transposase [Streptomyces lydicus]|nr:IS5 family transposase [Streptomyces lydicus]